MWLQPFSLLHIGHIPCSVFPLTPFNLQMPIFHHNTSIISRNINTPTIHTIHQSSYIKAAHHTYSGEKGQPRVLIENCKKKSGLWD
jgi:hypothetical protein